MANHFQSKSEVSLPKPNTDSVCSLLYATLWAASEEEKRVNKSLWEIWHKPIVSDFDSLIDCPDTSIAEGS